jgi:hypothetical protein
MCFIKIPIPIVVINQIAKYRRHCLWLGGDVNAKKPPLAAWKMVCRPNSKGGMGVIRLRLQNEVLLMKNLHKFFSKADLRWVRLLWTQHYLNGKVLGQRTRGSFLWRSNLKLLNVVLTIATA